MPPLVLHLIVSAPVIASLLFQDEAARLWGWYVADAAVIAFLLADRARVSGRFSIALVCLFGAAVHALAIGCAFSDSGACDKADQLPIIGISVLIGVGVVAEIIAALERRCTKKADQAATTNAPG